MIRMYAVVELQGHQYIVKKWDQITVDRVNIDGDLVVDSVVALFDEEGTDVKVGTPFVKGSKVEFKVVEDLKWDKISVIKFHRKNRYLKSVNILLIWWLKFQESYTTWLVNIRSFWSTRLRKSSPLLKGDSIRLSTPK